MSTTTFLKIKELLDANKKQYTHIVHEPVGKTSEDAAAIRGTPIEQGVKAIILKINDSDFQKNNPGKNPFFQVSIPGLNRIDLKKLKVYFNVKNISLASPEDVLKETDCTVGSVPPFATLFGMNVYADKSLLELDDMLFSAGTHTDTIIMKAQDYVEIVQPIIVDLKKDAEAK